MMERGMTLMESSSIIILHAHMPFITDYSESQYEQRWLYEALSESYIPMLWKLNDLKRPAVTISFSPTLMEMMADKIIQANYLGYLHKTIALIHAEYSREVQTERSVLDFYLKHYSRLIETFMKYGGNILDGYKNLYREEKIEVITTSATHAILPYLCTEKGVKIQVEWGIKTFQHHFGAVPKGFWLPEMAINEQTAKILCEQGIQYTFSDSPDFSEPAITYNGLTIFKRNRQQANYVWDKYSGYPAHPEYREYYRDVGFVREWDEISEFAFRKKVRVNTGLKLWGITGKTDDKKIYHPEKAFAQTKIDADDFMQKLNRANGLNVLPFDFELFGHWWFEGPEFLAGVLDSDHPFILPSEWLKKEKEIEQKMELSFSTWGKNGFGDMWLNEKTAGYFHQFHLMENHLFKTWRQSYVNSREMKQKQHAALIKEWMLAVSSDWTFMIENGTSINYGHNRIQTHIHQFNEICSFNEGQMKKYRPAADLFKYILYTEDTFQAVSHIEKPKILMLSTEYPPNIVGGLGRHVFDLTHALADMNYEVTLLTISSEEELPDYENPYPSLHIYRLKPIQISNRSLVEWIMNHNLAFVQFLLSNRMIDFDLVHAHEWLTAGAGKSIQKIFHVPMIATIHATELGRNSEIVSSMQKHIHEEEGLLVEAADKVIVCSDYMKGELIKQFKIPFKKLSIIPNGINPLKNNMYDKNSNKHQMGSLLERPFIFSMGRLVKEKGFDVLLRAIPGILARFPKIHFVIAGDGPHRNEYEKIAKQLNVQKSVTFLGFINEEFIHILLNHCMMNIIPSFYEPFGIVALESMAAKRLTIASNTGGLKEIVCHLRNGLLFERGNSAELASVVLKALDNTEWAKEMAQQGFEDVYSKYAYNRIVNQVIQEYEVLYHNG